MVEHLNLNLLAGGGIADQVFDHIRPRDDALEPPELIEDDDHASNAAEVALEQFDRAEQLQEYLSEHEGSPLVRLPRVIAVRTDDHIRVAITVYVPSRRHAPPEPCVRLVGIVFFVRPAGQPEAVLGSYIYKLPVNQSFTCEAGFKIWGFPKTVEEIDFSYADNSATCKLVMGGQHVLTLTVPRGGDGSTSDTVATGYTLIEAIPHQNEFTRGGEGEQTVPGGDGVVLELGDHALADELRALGVETAAPILSAWSEHMRGSFGQSFKLYTSSLGGRAR